MAPEQQEDEEQSEPSTYITSVGRYVVDGEDQQQQNYSFCTFTDLLPSIVQLSEEDEEDEEE